MINKKVFKYCVFGGLGFIGSNFIRYILAKYDDCEVFNLDKVTYAANKDNLKGIDKERYNFIYGDICDSDLVGKILETGEIDIVVNFAAETHVDRSISEPSVFVKTNVLGVNVLLEAIRKSKVKRFVQISTDEVYGSIEKGEAKEGDVLAPSSPYSASKASADLLCMSHYNTYKSPVVIVRMSNNFGPYQYPEKLVPLFITNLIEEKKVPLYGDGMNVREWLYVKDACDAIDYIIENGEDGEIYNVGGDIELTNIAITYAILEGLGKDYSYIEQVNDRPGHDRRYSIDTEKVCKLGWSPKIDFVDAMSETIGWYKSNNSWWSAIKEKEDYKKYYEKQYKKK
uniref:Putative GDP-mannose 4,6-dehydratase n=1 Tax=viral metagenome TaxID=1070528 RepID=A0A6M3MDK9_9ZZZZ